MPPARKPEDSGANTPIFPIQFIEQHKHSELEELGQWPQTRPAYERIKALQERVMKKFPWGWEEGPPKEYLEEKRGQQIIPACRQFLCWSCHNKSTP
jgi:hypothetical protein